METINLKMIQVSGATFTSHTSYTTLADLIALGYEFTDEQIEALKAGETVVLTTYNLAGTPFKRILKAI